MKKTTVVFITAVIAFTFVGIPACTSDIRTHDVYASSAGTSDGENGVSGPAAESENNREGSYMNITAQKAKEIMDTETGYIILDVRTREEFDAGHIDGAILIPDNEISKRAAEELADKDQLILVYCRSGRRSANAASQLAKLGYTNVINFGGILDWTYGVVK